MPLKFLRPLFRIKPENSMRCESKQNKRLRQPSNLPFCFYFWFKGLQSFCFSFSVPVPLIGPPLDKSPHLIYCSVGFSCFQCHFFQLLLETNPVRSSPPKLKIMPRDLIMMIPKCVTTKQQSLSNLGIETFSKKFGFEKE